MSLRLYSLCKLLKDYMFGKLPSGHGKSGAQQIPGEMFEFSGASSGLDLNGPPNSFKIISLKFLILHFKFSQKSFLQFVIQHFKFSQEVYWYMFLKTYLKNLQYLASLLVELFQQACRNSLCPDTRLTATYIGLPLRP